MRSLLFLPASRLDRYPKALASGADAVILDLEDGVEPSARPAARDALRDLSENAFENAADRVYLRISSLGETDGIRDMAAMLTWSHWPRGILLPKVEHAAQVAQMRSLSERAGFGVELMVTIETAIGLANAELMALQAGKVAGIAYGCADYTAETSSSMSREAMLYARSRVVNAAAVSRTPAIDGPWLDVHDENGLAADCAHGNDLGFSAKIAIHPNQVETINRTFSPTDTEIEWAQRVVQAALEAGDGAFLFEGQMIDAPVLAKAERVLTRVN